jgi:Skp family chaperone for outer membrane proteins
MDMRQVLRISGVLLIVGALVLASRSWSDAKPAPPRPQMKVRLLNLTYVMKNYEKVKTFNAELRAAARPFQDENTNYNIRMLLLAAGAQKSKTTPEVRKQLEAEGKELRKVIEDNKGDYQKSVGKKRQELLKILYADIEAATRRYARANDIDLVMHYHDAVTKAELDGAPNITRKLQLDSLMPMYTAPGMDISKEIVADLNARLRAKKDD